MGSRRIVVKRRDIKGFALFLKEVQEAALEGFIIDPDALGLKHGPSMNGQFSCWVHNEVEVEVQDPEGDTDKAPEGDTDKAPEGDTAVDEKEVEESKVESDPEVPVLDNKKATKGDLLKFAAEVGIVVSEDKKSPAAIRKFLKENINN